jgi:hypothetical protein
MPNQPPPAPLPTREQIIAGIRQQNSGHLIEQVINLEADKAVLSNQVIALRQRIAELEREIATVETTNGDAAGLCGVHQSVQ